MRAGLEINTTAIEASPFANLWLIWTLVADSSPTPVYELTICHLNKGAWSYRTTPHTYGRCCRLSQLSDCQQLFFLAIAASVSLILLLVSLDVLYSVKCKRSAEQTMLCSPYLQYLSATLALAKSRHQKHHRGEDDLPARVRPWPRKRTRQRCIQELFSPLQEISVHRRYRSSPASSWAWSASTSTR